MQHPQNDTMPHCLWNKNIVEMSIYKKRLSFRVCFYYHLYFFYISLCHLHQLTWLSPRMPPWRTADSKSSQTEGTEPLLLLCVRLWVVVWKRILCQGYVMPMPELCWGLFAFPVSGENEPADATETQNCILLHLQPRSFPKTEHQWPDLTLSLFSCPRLSGHTVGV